MKSGIELLNMIKETGLGRYRANLRTSILSHEKVLSIYNNIQFYRKPLEDISKMNHEDLINLIVYMEGKALKYIPNPSYIIKYYAKELGYEEYLIKPSKELKMTEDELALALSIGELEDFENYSSEVLIKAIRLKPNLITKIKKASDELQMEAIKLSPKLIGEINNVSISVIKQSLDLYPYLIRFIENLPFDLQMDAVRTNVNVIFELKTVSLQTLLETVKICPLIFEKLNFKELQDRVINAQDPNVRAEQKVKIAITAMHSYFYRQFNVNVSKEFVDIGFLRNFTPDTIQVLMPWIKEAFKLDTERFLKKCSEQHDNYLNMIKKQSEIYLHNHYDSCNDDYYYEHYNDNNDVADDHYSDHEDEDESYEKEFQKELNWEKEHYEPFLDGYYGDDYDDNDEMDEPFIDEYYDINEEIYK